MKKLISVLLITTILFSLSISLAEHEKKMETCLISAGSMAAVFDQKIWDGFEMLEEEGWKVTLIEALDTAEYEESIYAMAEAGMELIFLKGDALASIVIDIADDFHPQFPNIHFIFIDSYIEHELEFATSAPADPYEPSFFGGFVAALSTKSNEIGWIGRMDTINLARFRNGYIAGAQYANPDVKVNVGFTGDFVDPVKGQEAVYAMVANYPKVDIIAHAAYISGNGVIAACEEINMPCIGCDDWQGNMGKTVFWNTLKPVDLLVYNFAKQWYANEELGIKKSFNIAAGAIPYDNRDFEALPEEIQEKVAKLLEEVKAGTVDLFYGEFAKYKLDY